MNLQELDTPFAESDIEWRAAQVGESNGKPWVKCLAYVTNRAIMKRLDDVCGKGNWRNEYNDIPSGVECGISIKVDGEWVTKWDAAEETNIEAVKGGRSGAMKRAAVQWGVGRYLYDLTEGWGDICQNGKLSAKTKSNQWFKWNPPRLPSWAVPSNPDLDLVSEAIKNNDNEFVIENWQGVIGKVWNDLTLEQQNKLNLMISGE